MAGRCPAAWHLWCAEPVLDDRLQHLLLAIGLGEWPRAVRQGLSRTARRCMHDDHDQPKDTEENHGDEEPHALNTITRIQKPAGVSAGTVMVSSLPRADAWPSAAPPRNSESSRPTPAIADARWSSCPEPAGLAGYRDQEIVPGDRSLVEGRSVHPADRRLGRSGQREPQEGARVRTPSGSGGCYWSSEKNRYTAV